MKHKNIILSVVVLCLIPLFANSAGELSRYVRLKISAGDLNSGISAVEDYKSKHGVDTEYLDAVGWLARGSELLKQYDNADKFVAELRQEIPVEPVDKDELIIPFGAAIEVEGKLLSSRKGKRAAVQFLEKEFSIAKNIGLRSRIRKNINLLSLEGVPAPELNIADFIGPQPQTLAALKGKPVLLFLWAQWCGDCKAQAKTLGSVLKKYQLKGLVIIAPTRFYGFIGDKKATPEEEKSQIKKVWTEVYSELESVAITIDEDTMVKYGASSTPSYVLIDKKGIVKHYRVTRLSESELSRMIESVL